MQIRNNLEWCREYLVEFAKCFKMSFLFAKISVEYTPDNGPRKRVKTGILEKAPMVITLL